MAVLSSLSSSWLYSTTQSFSTNAQSWEEKMMNNSYSKTPSGILTLSSDVTTTHSMNLYRRTTSTDMAATGSLSTDMNFYFSNGTDSSSSADLNLNMSTLAAAIPSAMTGTDFVASFNATNFSTELKEPNGGGPSTGKIMVAVALLLFTTVTILGNILVIISPFLDSKLRNTFTYYIINLGVTDFLVAVMAMSFYSFDILLGYWPFGKVMCGIWIFFDYGMTFASVFTLVIISIDRYWSVGWSLHYRSYNTNKKCIIMITGVWLGVLIVWLGPCIMDRIRWSEPGICKWEPSKNKEFVIFVAVVGHHIPCAVIIYCYYKIYTIMRDKKKKTVAPVTTTAVVAMDTAKKVQQPNNQNTGSSNSRQKPKRNLLQPILPDNTTMFENQAGRHVDIGPRSLAWDGASMCSADVTTTNTASAKSQVVYTDLAIRHKQKEDRERKAFVMLSYILFSYLICWVPFHVVFDVSSIRPDLVPEWVYTATFWMTYCNSTINPFVYAFTSSSFRKAFLKILKCKICTKG